MQKFKWTLRILALIPLVTGLLEVFLGISSLKTVGVILPDAVWAQPSVDNGWRFLGTMWTGYAVLIWYATGDIERHAGLMKIILILLFVSGLVRAASVVSTGWPIAPFVAAMFFELLAMPLLYLWLQRLLSRKAGGAW
jgi:hypothetical protein